MLLVPMRSEALGEQQFRNRVDRRDMEPGHEVHKDLSGMRTLLHRANAVIRIAHRRFVKRVIPVELHDNRLEQPLHWRKPRRGFRGRKTSGKAFPPRICMRTARLAGGHRAGTAPCRRTRRDRAASTPPHRLETLHK